MLTPSTTSAPRDVARSLAQPLGYGIGALVVEPHAVAQGSQVLLAPRPRLLVSRLTLSRHGADLDERETRGRQAEHGLSVLVHAGGKTHPAGEGQPQRLDALVDLGQHADGTAGPKRPGAVAHPQDTEAVCALGIDVRENMVVEGAIHATTVARRRLEA
ncbi:hypothetical protein GCM10025876_02320 [Demequina litorisediminis]|uniref:Uncharacterized protein n=1 Tax=Demequina litorisediminis TaxID=1849022 RepID=A0ABQ6I873_9MICO|nr:hypothetical protein GCM10025876_02320 [Demequina litorisediminis]